MKSVKVLMACAIGVLLYFAHVAFVPVGLALLFALVLSGPVETLHGWRVPRSLSAAVLLIVILGIFAALVDFISVPAQQWFATAPHTLRLIERKIRPVEQLMSRIDTLRNSAGNIGSSNHGTPVPTVTTPEQSASQISRVTQRLMVHDKSVRRSAQDDGFVGVVMKIA